MVGLLKTTEFKAIIVYDCHITVQQISKRLSAKLKNQLESFGLDKKINIWVPHRLKEIHSTQ